MHERVGAEEEEESSDEEPSDRGLGIMPNKDVCEGSTGEEETKEEHQGLDDHVKTYLLEE